MAKPERNQASSFRKRSIKPLLDPESDPVASTRSHMHKLQKTNFQLRCSRSDPGTTRRFHAPRLQGSVFTWVFYRRSDPGPGAGRRRHVTDAPGPALLRTPFKMRGKNITREGRRRGAGCGGVLIIIISFAGVIL